MDKDLLRWLTRLSRTYVSFDPVYDTAPTQLQAETFKRRYCVGSVHEHRDQMYLVIGEPTFARDTDNHWDYYVKYFNLDNAEIGVFWRTSSIEQDSKVVHAPL